MSRITLIAQGTRGDAQPAVALGKALQAEGHRVRVLASANFAAWIAAHGLEAAVSTVDIQALMLSSGGQEWVESGHNPLAEVRAMKRLFAEHGWGLIRDAWEAAQDADLLLSSFTSDAFALSIAEKLRIPHASMLGQPALLATRHGASLPNAPLPGRVSLINYLFGKLVLEPFPWQMQGALINRLRREVLNLPPQTRRENTAARRRMLTLLGYSPRVVPHPPDWPPNTHPTGYWFLDEHTGWQPPDALQAFLAAGAPPVVVGFGSMTGRNPRRITEIVAAAVRQAGVRAVLLSGWAELGQMALPDSILCLPAAPHGWLFPRAAAVVHHGGAGTTAAGLRAGIPTVVVPHFADQPFWGRRVHALGVGPAPIPRAKLTPARLAAAMHTAVSDPTMRRRAADLGAAIRAEDGLETAVALLDRHLTGK